MMIRNFFELSHAQALVYLDHVVRREPARLSDLAHWMAETAGPLDQMDASRQSLVPLWTWMKDFILQGSPGVPRDALSSCASVLHMRVESPEEARARYVLETVEHYVLLVIRREFDDAHWDVFEQKPGRYGDALHHATGIRYHGERFYNLDLSLGGMARNLLRHQVRAGEDGRLDDGVNAWFEQPPMEPATPTGSVLTALANQPAIPATDPSRAVPAFAEEPQPTPSVNTPRAGEELVFAAIGASFDEDHDSHPVLPELPRSTVSEGLSALGFRTSTGALIEADDLSHEGQFLHRDEIAAASTLLDEGSFYGLFLEPIAATEEEWSALTTGLNELGTRVGARLAPGDHFTAE